MFRTDSFIWKDSIIGRPMCARAVLPGTATVQPVGLVYFCY